MKTYKLLIALVLSWILVSALRQADAQMNTQVAETSAPPSTAATPNDGCFEYEVNVVSLKGNTKEIHWDSSDCIRIGLSNNPFIYNYVIEVNQQPIPEDDILGSLGKAIGLPQPSDVSATTTTDHTTTDTKKAQADSESAAKNQAERLKSLAPDKKTERAIANIVDPKTERYSVDIQSRSRDKLAPAYSFKDLQEDLQRDIDKDKSIDKTTKQKLQDTIKKELPGCENISVNLSRWGGQEKQLGYDAAALAKNLRTKEDVYLKLWKDAEWRTLQDQSIEPMKVQQIATRLRARFVDVMIQLGPDYPEDGFESKFVEFARSAAALHGELVVARGCQDPSEQSQVTAVMDQLDAQATSVVLTACRYKAKQGGDFSAVENGLINPIDDVLKKPLAFSWQYARRVGPYSDPMFDSFVLKRDEVTPALNAPAPNAAQYECVGDPSAMLNHGATYAQFSDFFKPAQRSTSADDVQALSTITPKQKVTASTEQAGQNKPISKSDNATPTTIVLEQPWLFGKPRAVVSGGITAGFLRKQEFQRSDSITPNGNSQTVIGLKTDSSVRLLPMLYGHILLPVGRKHDPEGWFGTVGVTASSDNKGTSPEFLLGISRSLANQKFFLTAGAYIGEQQKLDAGLKVGEVIPSSLTGELPVTKSYRAGFAIGISFRFASSKDPKKDASADTSSKKSATKGGS